MDIKSIALFVSTLVLSVNASAAVIDFNTVDSYTSSGRIDRIGDITFSRDLYSFPDGLELYNDNGNNLAYNYYGENGEFLSFDSAVTLQSMDFSGVFLTLPQASQLVIKLLDSSDTLLSSLNLPPSSFQTLVFNQSNVSKIMIDFSGGNYGFYGDDRYHAWYAIDNITYDISAVPVPAAVWLFGSGLLSLIGVTRRKKA